MAPTCKIVSVMQSIPKDELYLRLYLHHTFREPNQNQKIIVDPNIANSFGVTVVNDWPMTEEPGANSKVIARAQGLHIQAGMITPRWYNSFGIVFEADRFKGSTLQVMGPVVESEEWAIVGGTGEFLLAQGTIYKERLEQNSNGDVIQLDIHAFYSPMSSKNPIWNLGHE